MNWSDLIDWKYWLEGFVGPGATMVAPIVSIKSAAFYGFIIPFVLFIIAGLFITIYSQFLPYNHPFHRRRAILVGHLVTLGFLGLFWFLCREISVAYLGGRFWFLIGSLYTLVFAIYMSLYYKGFYKIELNYYRKHRHLDK